MARRVAILAAAVLLAAPCALACTGWKVSVAATGTTPAQPLVEDAFDVDGVRQHIETQLPITGLKRNTASSFSCVDARGEVPQLGTPGGDFAELAAGIATYLKLAGIASNSSAGVAATKAAFAAFMDQVASPDRPFYLHTSDEKLHKVFKAVKAAGVSPAPVVFPEIKPNGANGDIWVNTLANVSLQGCGHVRLLGEKFSDYGLDSPDLITNLLKEFYNYWWGTQPGSPQRAKVSFTIVQGPLNGDAVAIVDSAGACPGLSPPVIPSHFGSQVFVYHPTAVSDFRSKTLTPFFVNFAKSQGKTIAADDFSKALTDLQGLDLKETLTLLPPANSVNLISVTVTVQDDGTIPAAVKNAAALNVAKNVPAAPNAAPKNAAPKNAPAAPKNAVAPKNAPPKNSAGRRMV